MNRATAAAPSHLAHAKKDAEIIYVGKKGGDHTLSQDGITLTVTGWSDTWDNAGPNEVRAGRVNWAQSDALGA